MGQTDGRTDRGIAECPVRRRRRGTAAMRAGRWLTAVVLVRAHDERAVDGRERRGTAARRARLRRAYAPRQRRRRHQDPRAHQGPRHGALLRCRQICAGVQVAHARVPSAGFRS